MQEGWTISTLKEHIEKILAEKDKAINIALAAAKEAVGVAEKNAEKWRDSANEWRQAMNDKDRLLMQRSEFISYKESVEKAMSLAKEKDDKGEGKSAGMGKVLNIIYVLLGSAIAALISYLLK